MGHFSQAAFSDEVFIRPKVESHWLNLKTLARGSEEMAGMVGRSGLIRGVFSAVERLGPYKATVLIQGESGTGKELVARALTVAARHDWPGNVREFAHALESAMLLTANDRIDVRDLPARCWRADRRLSRR